LSDDGSLRSRWRSSSIPLGLQRSAARAASAASDGRCGDAKDDAEPAPASDVCDEDAKGVEDGLHVVLLFSSAAAFAIRACIFDGTLSSRTNAERWEENREKPEYDGQPACDLWAISAVEVLPAATGHRRDNDENNPEDGAANGEAPELRFVIVLTCRIARAPRINDAGIVCAGTA
jgi:hypothetical protein